MGLIRRRRGYRGSSPASEVGPPRRVLVQGSPLTATSCDHTLQRWTCGCDPMLEGLKLAAEQTGNIDAVVVPDPPPPGFVGICVCERGIGGRLDD